jgi:hypothetical protein
MRQVVALTIAVSILALPCAVQAATKSCDELKSEIQAKLEAKGVAHFKLEIVAKDAEATGAVVGTCEAGSKKIVYTRG